ncbi:helix-turn-helix domain-containing protein [Chitinophaga sp. GbtcB8]|uniref:helix-turn-helix domain-containing protein n=1 Tax=Chitinophaga sp. GbtcB8 TaxID=2824753 RepID=UPI001C30812B|nr:helix-turn-helix domain-containing protein [Chitinophaga sp. GbtcB8]
MGAFFMDKRGKYSFKEKLAAVVAVEKGKESILSAANRLGCSRSRIRQWLGHYREQGKAGLKLRVNKYSGQFRVRVIKYMLDKGLSLTETCSAFGIPNMATVYRWLTIFKQHGHQALLELQRGRKAISMARKKKQPDTNLTPEAQKLAALQAEVEWLRAENAFLKKLDALIQEEAQNRLKKERKPSGN